MATTNGSQVSEPDAHALRYKWLAIPNGNQGNAVSLNVYQDRTVQIGGTFGAGGSVSIQGSNDDGANWATLTDPLGNALTFTAAGLKPVTQLPHKIRPSVTAGDGTTSINVWLHARGAHR
ncbi:hypothetical protein [Mesorhizobium sp. M8A.F.Ca.ET.165.01.1.1]|uniref:hypothetical protein n=1 Tax=Mesorhizobium sp. M8A.F.Ca.ET.165.01.1.1 TaxID=2563960 RepID=UPI001093C261|nr:hypothetical protein [Mesorhizobium sp. M8A.F.Ca.ET.165.01.1.1]TGT35690.1 hypothetical protein EN808_31900 [Mesorhizobium sp. M8A.F.Ca.ET.165.01.1.1]